jgi:hypothetical protein
VQSTKSDTPGMRDSGLTRCPRHLDDAQLGQVASFIQTSAGKTALSLDSRCSWWAWPAASVPVCRGTKGRFASKTEIAGAREHLL